MAITKIKPNQLNDYNFNNSLARQAIINGNFDVWQRGTSKANVNGIEILADRWKMYTASASQANTFSQSDGTGVPGSQYSAKWQRTAGQTGTVNFLLGTSLETKDSIKLRGKKLTLSFWAKCGANYSAANNYLVSYIKTGTGTDGEVILGFIGDAAAAQANNVLTTSWQKFTLTTTDVIAASVNQIGIMFADTPVGTAGADDWFEITQVQLCAGDVALPFMPNSFNQELLDCQRYYEKSYDYGTALGASVSKYFNTLGTADVNTYLTAWVRFRVEKRGTPTIRIWDMAGNLGKVTKETAAGVSTSNITPSATDDMKGSTGFRVYVNNSASAGIYMHWDADAEL